jgi:very-short-patch-repair endonuclease
MSKKLTNIDFIHNAKNVHGDKYDYSLVEYINAKTKVKIICPKHGIFEQTPNNHISNKNGCPKCKNLITDFIEKANAIHNNKYDYSLVNYQNSKSKVKIICPKHGIFEQTPNNHINLKQGCPLCSKNNNDSFIEKANVIHNNKYDYSLVNYQNSKSKVKIICPVHGVFEQTYDSHILKKCGCPNCKISKGENEIKTFLIDNNIYFINQYKFDNCKNKRKLPFDFYLPDLNVCIEFDGEQHFRKHKLWGEEKLIQTQTNDQIKNIFCIENNIKLIRIKFDENINKKLKLYF